MRHQSVINSSPEGGYGLGGERNEIYCNSDSPDKVTQRRVNTEITIIFISKTFVVLPRVRGADENITLHLQFSKTAWSP